MRSVTPKVLHRIGGRSLVDHAVTAARGLEPQHLVVVVRHERDAVITHPTMSEGLNIVLDSLG